MKNISNRKKKNFEADKHGVYYTAHGYLDGNDESICKSPTLRGLIMTLKKCYYSERNQFPHKYWRLRFFESLQVSCHMEDGSQFFIPISFYTKLIADREQWLRVSEIPVHHPIIAGLQSIEEIVTADTNGEFVQDDEFDVDFDVCDVGDFKNSKEHEQEVLEELTQN